MTAPGGLVYRSGIDDFHVEPGVRQAVHDIRSVDPPMIGLAEGPPTIHGVGHGGILVCDRIEPAWNADESPAAGPEHSTKLPHRRTVIVYVLEDVDADRGVERGVREWQRRQVRHRRDTRGWDEVDRSRDDPWSERQRPKLAGLRSDGQERPFERAEQTTLREDEPRLPVTRLRIAARAVSVRPRPKRSPSVGEGPDPRTTTRTPMTGGRRRSRPGRSDRSACTAGRRPVGAGAATRREVSGDPPPTDRPRAPVPASPGRRRR